LFSAFSFDAKGTKEKANKKKMPIREFRLCGGDKGYAPLTAPPFEKGGRKLSILARFTSLN